MPIEPAPFPLHESYRLRALGGLHLLHTEPETRFDQLTERACRHLDAPYAAINLVADSYEWIKSHRGRLWTTRPREESFCAHAILANDIFIVPDLSYDERFADNALVRNDPHLRFYAARPLRAGNGHAVGTLCVFDNEPRMMSDHEFDLLDDLGVLVEREFEVLPRANLDELTGLQNRRGLEALAPRILVGSRMSELSASLLYFDLSPYHRQHTLGRAEHDRLLRTFADLLKKTYRQSDLISRLNGDAFVVLAGDTDPVGAQRMQQRLQQAVEAAASEGRAPRDFSFECGSATTPLDCDDTLEALLAFAIGDRKTAIG